MKLVIKEIGKVKSKPKKVKNSLSANVKKAKKWVKEKFVGADIVSEQKSYHFNAKGKQEKSCVIQAQTKSGKVVQILCSASEGFMGVKRFGYKCWRNERDATIHAR